MATNNYGPMQNLKDPEYLDNSPTSPQEDRDVSFAKSLLQTDHSKAPGIVRYVWITNV